jgi:hypothetical protein
MGQPVLIVYAREVDMALLTHDIETVLKGHGIPARPHVVVHGCPDAVPVVRGLAGDEVTVTDTHGEVVQALRGSRVVAVLTNAERAGPLIKALSSENLTTGVLVIDLAGDGTSAAHLRAQGAMDVVNVIDAATLQPLLRRALDFSALLTLELAHRCESRRLLNRELELLGQPPESMSDDLSVFQPPPLPVGPLSVYNLEEASESFETAYIDRVQQLCASAREAAVHLGVSSATLSRRLRREGAADGS